MGNISLVDESDTSTKGGHHRSNRDATGFQDGGLCGACVLRFANAGGGTIQVGRRYDDFDEYVLRSLRLYAPSEHTFHGRRTTLEVQLWHVPKIQSDLAAMQRKRVEVKKAL